MSESARTTDVATAEALPPRPASSFAAKLRLSFLIVVLVVMLSALWYDYMVARPNVEMAYSRIATLNTAMNSARSYELTSRSHVHQALGRSPTRLIKNGIYTIEVYEWPAGMPLSINAFDGEEPTFGMRTHDYYAVFLGQALQRHYKFAVPPEEWDRASDISVRQLLAMLAESTPAAPNEGALEMPPGMNQPITPGMRGQGPPGEQGTRSRPRRPEIEIPAPSGKVQLISAEEDVSDGSVPAEAAEAGDGQ